MTATTVAASSCLTPPWVAATATALTLFFALKLATLLGIARLAAPIRLLGYFALWPGMNAPAFLRGDVSPSRPPARELGFAACKLALGLALAYWTVTHAFTWPTRWVGAVGLASALLTFHFGLFHALSCFWRRVGIDAPPLMRAPLAASSLADFWGARWNTAFATLARRFLLRPLARPCGARAAALVVFLVSGVLHELAISLPARGGWGGPTLYFLLQAGGLAVEKSPFGRRLGLGLGLPGRTWTLACTLTPLPLLFHAPLLERVVAPLFRFFKEVL